MFIYRLHRSVRPAADFAGALLAGGRWNPAGTPMLYASQHLSLACLEVLVHLDKSDLPPEYVWSATELPNTPGLVEVGDLHDIRACQEAGRSWAYESNNLAVRVPSVVIPQEFNVLLNPAHRQYASLVWSGPKPFRFDSRLFTFEPAD
jgi:RES domain-containing protein